MDKEKLYSLIISNDKSMIAQYMRDHLRDRIWDTRVVFISESKGVNELRRRNSFKEERM